MVGIAQHNLRAQRLQILRVQGFHRALGAHGHENGGGYIAMRQMQRTQTRTTGVYLV